MCLSCSCDGIIGMSFLCRSRVTVCPVFVSQNHVTVCPLFVRVV